MKKYLVLILIFAMILSMTACSPGQKELLGFKGTCRQSCSI